MRKCWVLLFTALWTGFVWAQNETPDLNVMEEDYITPVLVGGAGSTFIGNVVYSNVGIANNVPFAAALATVPVAIMAVYLIIAKRLGAFEAL